MSNNPAFSFRIPDIRHNPNFSVTSLSLFLIPLVLLAVPLIVLVHRDEAAQLAIKDGLHLGVPPPRPAALGHNHRRRRWRKVPPGRPPAPLFPGKCQQGRFSPPGGGEIKPLDIVIRGEERLVVLTGAETYELKSQSSVELIWILIDCRRAGSESGVNELIWPLIGCRRVNNSQSGANLAQ